MTEAAVIQFSHFFTSRDPILLDWLALQRWKWVPGDCVNTDGLIYILNTLIFSKGNGARTLLCMRCKRIFVLQSAGLTEVWTYNCFMSNYALKWFHGQPCVGQFHYVSCHICLFHLSYCILCILFHSLTFNCLILLFVVIFLSSSAAESEESLLLSLGVINIAASRSHRCGFTLSCSLASVEVNVRYWWKCHPLTVLCSYISIQVFRSHISAKHGKIKMISL